MEGFNPNNSSKVSTRRPFFIEQLIDYIFHHIIFDIQFVHQWSHYRSELINILNKRTLFLAPALYDGHASNRSPTLLSAPACQPLNAHRYLPAKREEYSTSPVAPRAAKGPHKNQRWLASHLTSTAELPLQQSWDYTQLLTRKYVKPQFGSVTLRSPILLRFLPFPFFYMKMRPTYFPNY